MNYHTRLRSLSDCVVFFDFDNTITPFDVLDDIIKRFSVNRDWIRFEKLWKNGDIGSKECLKNQLKSVRITRPKLRDYLIKVRLDPYFHKLIDLLRREGIEPIVLSDSFSFIIKSILRNNGIKKVKIYSNLLRFYKDTLIPAFPHTNKNCKICAHCKKYNLKKNHISDKIIVYIGDGLSDVCPAEHSDIVFAKGSLLNYFRKNKRLCLAFKDLKDIFSYLRGLEK